jgi:hypothetical protein
VASLPVLVISCDRYADLWRPFFELFWRRWPDCPGPVYLGTNLAGYDDPRVRTLRIGADVTWAAGVLKMLDHLESEYAIVMLEDFLLMEPVDNARIERLAGVAVSEGLGCLRLYSIYPPATPVPGHPELGTFEPGDDWRITAQAAIWHVDTLRRLLVPGFSAWDFEMVGSQMSEFMPDRIWGVMKPALVYDHAVEKGRWRPQGLEICRQAGVPVDVSARGAFTASELLEHERAGVESGRLAMRKTAAINFFKLGRRAEGWREVASCLRRAPWSAQLWAIAGAGMLGPAAITALHRMHVQRKIAQAGRHYDRAARAHPARSTPASAVRGAAGPR